MPNKIEEIKDMHLSKPYENAVSLQKHIKNFCAGRVIVTSQVVVDLKQAAKIAAKQARGEMMNGNIVKSGMFFIGIVSVFIRPLLKFTVLISY